MARKGENIYKRKDGRWEGRYIKSRTQTGKAIYGYVYAKSYREVKSKLQEKIFSISMIKEDSLTTKDVLFENITLEWIGSIEANIKESTNNKYRNLLSLYILPKYGEFKLHDITYESIENFCSELLLKGGKKGTGLSPKTVADILSLMRNIIKFAKKKGIKIDLDISNIQVKQRASRMRVLSRIEQEKLYKHIVSDLTPYHIGILICLYTGIRIGELCALRWEDISFEEETICIQRTMQRIQNKNENTKKTKIIITTPKSNCSIRTIPMSKILIDTLSVYQTSSEGYVLTNSESKFIEPRAMQNHFKKVLKICEIEAANFHSLRHTFATRCVEVGFDVKSLSEILGHATVNITMNRYVHPSLELKKENMKKLSLLFSVN